MDIEVDGKLILDLQIMADRYPRIVIQCLDGKNALHSDQYRCIPAASLKGISSKPALFQMKPTYSHVAISFFPHGVKALFGIDGYETVDSILDLRQFFPDEVIDRIIQARQKKTRISVLEKHLLQKLAVISAVDSRIVNFLHMCPGTHYGRLLNDYGISERHFERKFLQSIGFTPSYYKRVTRFEKTYCRILKGDYESLSSLAYELGYADQSHLNRDFKELSGATPLSLIKKDGLVIESGSLLTS